MSLCVEEADLVRQSIAEVHSSSSSTKWVLCGRKKTSKNVLRFIGKGSGGLEEIGSQLYKDNDDMQVMYGLIDLGNSSFIFITWYSNTVDGKRVTSYSREISVMFMPYQSWSHIDLRSNSRLEDILGKYYSTTANNCEKGPVTNQSITAS